MAFDLDALKVALPPDTQVNLTHNGMGVVLTHAVDRDNQQTFETDNGGPSWDRTAQLQRNKLVDGVVQMLDGQPVMEAVSVDQWADGVTSPEQAVARAFFIAMGGDGASWAPGASLG